MFLEFQSSATSATARRLRFCRIVVDYIQCSSGERACSNVRLARPPTPTPRLAAKMMQLHYCALAYAILECYTAGIAGMSTSRMRLTTAKWLTPSMTRICGILHIGRAHRAALCRKKESAYLSTGATRRTGYPMPRIRLCACVHVRAQRACKSSTLDTTTLQYTQTQKEGGGLSLTDLGVSPILNHAF